MPRTARLTGDSGQPAAVVETHSGTVFFVGDRAYKVKKPVDFGFLDFTTLAARREACHREVDLNRRLSPDVYLGVADVVGPSGEVCDHLVMMRRLPADRRLSALLAAGEDVDDALRSVARQLAVLHARSPTSVDRPEIAEVATRAAVSVNWADNLATIAAHTDGMIDADDHHEVSRLTRRYLAGRGDLFASRIAKGDVRDGHGDLLAQDIFCLDDGPRILDCLEFADQYRFGDVLLDAAFLAMDLERLGHPAAAARFLAWYHEFSGEQHPPSLVHHYIAYRAGVRAKVACLRADQGEPAAADEARALHGLALRHLRAGRVVLAVVGGLPGTGKSTVARTLADANSWACLRSDELRKDLAGIGHASDASSALGEGLYRPELVDRVYEVMISRAKQLLAGGQSCVLDASWMDPAQRARAAALAEETVSDLVEIECRAPEEVALSRIVSRVGDASDATPEVHAHMAATSSSWPAASILDTAGSVDALPQLIDEAVRAQLRSAGE